MDIYSPFKVLHHSDKIKLLKQNKLQIPAQVQIDVTNVCNHNCSYCVHRSNKVNVGVDFEKTQFIKTERLLKLLEELKEAGVKAVLLQGGGEPFLHPGIIETIKKIDDLGLEYGIITNGTAIKDKHIPLLKNASWIRFSVDAASDETYKKVQVTNNNIPKETIKKIKETCSKTIIGLSFLTKPENFQEAYSFALMAKNLAVNNIRYSIVQTLKGNDIMELYYEEYFKLLEKAAKLKTESFRVFGLKDRREALKNNKNYPKCYYQHFVGSIAANGNLYLCCWTKNITKFNIGNINNQNFKEAWFGEKRKEHLTNHDLKECPPCWFDETNKLLNYLMKKDPEHVNFV
ncbi:MAG: radical SAM protein [DPANN group archaeon]|nr:radical SAM protein [DPANN group archaeon]